MCSTNEPKTRRSTSPMVNAGSKTILACGNAASRDDGATRIPQLYRVGTTLHNGEAESPLRPLAGWGPQVRGSVPAVTARTESRSERWPLATSPRAAKGRTWEFEGGTINLPRPAWSVAPGQPEVGRPSPSSSVGRWRDRVRIYARQGLWVPGAWSNGRAQWGSKPPI